MTTRKNKRVTLGANNETLVHVNRVNRHGKKSTRYEVCSKNDRCRKITAKTYKSLKKQQDRMMPRWFM